MTWLSIGVLPARSLHLETVLLALGVLALPFHLPGLGGSFLRRRCSRFEWDGRLRAAHPAGAVVIPAPSL